MKRHSALPRLGDQEASAELRAPYADQRSLHQAVMAFGTKDKPFVVADPGYEAGARAAKFIGQVSFKYRSARTFRHDVKAMARRAPRRAIYICNPTISTSITPRADIEGWWPTSRRQIIMLDERTSLVERTVRL